MRTFAKLVSGVVLLCALAVFAQPTFAATRTKTLTESTINASYHVTNPKPRQISEMSVDLQPGQVVFNFVWTTRAKKASPVVATLTPSVTDGKVTWTLTSMTVNGEPISADLQTQINTRISSSWAKYIRGKAGAATVTDLTITDTDITWTVETTK